MLVTQVITRLIRGGAQFTLYNLVKGLALRGQPVEVVCGPEAGSEGSILGEVKDLGVPVTVLPSLGRELSPLGDASVLLALSRHFRHRRPGLVHVHTSKAGLLGGMAARLCGVPRVVYTAQGHIFARAGAVPSVTERPLLRPAFLTMRRLAESCADRVVALTPSDLEEQVGLGLAPREKYAVIPNGVDPAPFRTLPSKGEARRALGLPVEGTYVIAVGRLSPEKGQDLFLEAIRRLPGVQGLLVGDGPMRKAWEAKAERVRFLGLRPDVPLCLAAADLYLLPSRYEAQGMVVVEAMMAGLPIVATRVGGVPGLVEDGRTGVLVPPEDPGAWAEAISVLLGAPARARGLGEAAKQASSAYSTDAMVDAYVRLYEGIR